MASLGFFQVLLLLVVSFVIFVIYLIKPVLFLQGLLVLTLILPTSNVSTEFFSIELLGYHVLWTDVLLAMVIVRWLGSRLRGREQYEGSLGRRIRYLIFGLLGWTFMEVVIGFWQNYETHQILYDARPVLYFLAVLVSMEYLGDERTLVSTIKGFIVGIVLYSVLTLSYFLVGSAHPLASLFETQRYSFVTRITYHNENYFLIAFPLLLLLILQLKGGLTKKIWLMAGLVLLSSQLFISLNRTTLVLVVASIGISLVFYEMFWRRSGLLKSSFSTILLVGGLILVIGYLLITQILPALYGVNSLEFLSHWMGRFDITSRYVYQASVANRIDMFRAGLQAILDSPVFGHGYGFLFRIKGWIGLVSFIDSTWITVWIRSGLVGVALLFGIVVIYSRSILRVLRSGDVQNVYVRVFYCALAGGGIGLLIQSLVKDSMLINSTAVLPLLIIVGASMQYSENLFRNALNQKN